MVYAFTLQRLWGLEIWVAGKDLIPVTPKLKYWKIIATWITIVVFRDQVLEH